MKDNASLSEMRTFPQIVSDEFRFLIADFGFRIQESSERCVLYSKPPLSVVIFQEHASGMIYLEIVRLDTAERYALHEVLAAIAPDEIKRAQCCGTDEASVRRCARQLSDISQQYLRDLLVMDEALFARIAVTSKRLRRKITLDAQYGATMYKADKAWEAKNWTIARELYAAARPALNPTQRRRFAFLERLEKPARENGETG